jgi:hypothetical protein
LYSKENGLISTELDNKKTIEMNELKIKLTNKDEKNEKESINEFYSFYKEYLTKEIKCEVPSEVSMNTINEIIKNIIDSKPSFSLTDISSNTLILQQLYRKEENILKFLNFLINTSIWFQISESERFKILSFHQNLLFAIKVREMNNFNESSINLSNMIELCIVEILKKRGTNNKFSNLEQFYIEISKFKQLLGALSLFEFNPNIEANYSILNNKNEDGEGRLESVFNKNQKLNLEKIKIDKVYQTNEIFLTYMEIFSEFKNKNKEMFGIKNYDLYEDEKDEREKTRILINYNKVIFFKEEKEYFITQLEKNFKLIKEINDMKRRDELIEQLFEISKFVLYQYNHNSIKSDSEERSEFESVKRKIIDYFFSFLKEDNKFDDFDENEKKIFNFILFLTKEFKDYKNFIKICDKFDRNKEMNIYFDKIDFLKELLLYYVKNRDFYKIFLIDMKYLKKLENEFKGII